MIPEPDTKNNSILSGSCPLTEASKTDAKCDVISVCKTISHVFHFRLAPPRNRFESSETIPNCFRPLIRQPNMNVKYKIHSLFLFGTPSVDCVTICIHYLQTSAKWTWRQKLHGSNSGYPSGFHFLKIREKITCTKA